MSTVHGLRLAGAFLALAGAITSSQVLGDSSRGNRPLQRAQGPAAALKGEEPNRFSRQAAISYQTQAGDRLFGLQLKPVLPFSPTGQPRDFVAMIDTSASQAGESFTMARSIAKGLADALRPDDTLSIWTVNIPAATRNLTGGFRSPKTSEIAAALTKLETTEYAAGVCDLKDALKKIVKEFDIRAGRQPVVLLLGDGESAFSPVANAERY